MMTNSDSMLPRRNFLARAAAGLALVTAALPRSAEAADLALGWKESEHDAWMKAVKGEHRQLFHALELNERAMLMASNYLDAYRDDFGAKPGQAGAAIGVHGPALAIGFNDAAWQKYGFGKSGNVMDPSTGQTSVRNIFAKGGALSVETLQGRGVLFIMCNTALRLMSQSMAKARNEAATAIYEDLRASRLPGTILVPAMVVAINRAQKAGITYLRA